MTLLQELLSDYFLDEDTEAADQAKQLGLVYKGFGRWADPQTGKVTHKTKKGQLVPVDPQQGELPLDDPKAEPEPTRARGEKEPGRREKRRKPDPDEPVSRPSPGGGVPRMAKAGDPPEKVKTGPNQVQLGKKFQNMLKKHDWYYDYSDDHSVWRKGELQRRELEKFIDDSGIDPQLAQKLWQKHAPRGFEMPGDHDATPPRDGSPTADDEPGDDYWDQEAEKDASQRRGEMGLDMDPL